MAKLTTYEYEGQEITFEFADGNKMINATEMVKSFKDKRVNNFLRSKQTKEYIEALEKRYADSRIAYKREVLRVVKGGDASKGGQGTWMDEKLALKFAAWLSIDFELWIYDRIFELLTTGKTELQAVKPSNSLVKSIRLIADQLEAHDKDITDMKTDIGEIKDYVSDLEAKITSIDEQYYTVSGYCALNNIACPLDKARTWGYNATKESNQQGLSVGKAYDAKYGTINTYHEKVLKKVVH
ncbi:MAG: KilA-N domain-containing protein [Aureispira sp.]